jgi:superfamily I DNA and/or RNA helicase
LSNTQHDPSTAVERRSLEGLVMRAANLVFATTNSGDLERLIEERGQFDWTIVEEAGKATGCELVPPLMLSHRRLLIGDHKQLPPFGAEQLDALLDNEDAVREALKTLPRLIDRTVHMLLDDELLEFMEVEGQDVEALCTEAKRVLYLFETALTTELERQRRHPGGKPIASTLNVQHRMHPTICELVSRTFYGGDLTTSERRRKEAEAQAGWIASKDSNILPDLPVVLVDMPYERSSRGHRRIERLPRFTNEDEVAEVVHLVAQLSVTERAEKMPSLVILTPYAGQVRRLHDAVLADPAASAAMNAFGPVARGQEWFSTVDAFQGNEADVVIFSLVRNNRGATVRKALGFVGDRRRFNVLISRARQRLIFVGSLEFLRTISAPLGLESDPASDFLRKFLDTLEEMIRDGRAGRVIGRTAQGARP